jgi:hypothetical protein
LNAIWSVYCRLCWYVPETSRQENGSNYSQKSIYSLHCVIQRVTGKNNNVPFSFLDKNDICFIDLHKTLDSICNYLHSGWIEAGVKSALLISYDFIWAWRHVMAKGSCWLLQSTCLILYCNIDLSYFKHIPDVHKFSVHTLPDLLYIARVMLALTNCWLVLFWPQQYNNDI